MNQIKVPPDFNYIGIFLTLNCNMNCSYCINKHSVLKRRETLSGKEWIDALNKIQVKGNLPLSLCGGEPTLHPEFYTIVEGISPNTKLDLLTNMSFDVEEFMRKVSPLRFAREAPYASIRASYHAEHTEFEPFMEKVSTLNYKGYSIGVWEILMPGCEKETYARQGYARSRGIDYRLKELLGYWKGRTYGHFAFDGAVGADYHKHCSCKTSELLVDSRGDIYRCHADLYRGLSPIGSLLCTDGQTLGGWMPCKRYGSCNPCDLKVKFDRFQVGGHCSVDIKDITPPSAHV